MKVPHITGNKKSALKDEDGVPYDVIASFWNQILLFSSLHSILL